MKTFKELVGVIVESKEEAKAIRTLLKTYLGLTSKDVSVKMRSGGSAVTVAIKTMKALLKKTEIEEISTRHEAIQRDEHTGEILSGGNTFIFTEIDYKFQDELKEKIQKEFEKETKGTFEKGDNVKLYKTFDITYFEDGTVRSFLHDGSHTSTEVKDLNYVGTAIMYLISSAKNDRLYSKIK